MKTNEAVLTRGKLAQATGVHIETIRFYEKKGILTQPERSAAGYRQYDGNSVKQIHFIQRAQDLGFTLTEISELLKLRDTPERSSGEVRKMAQEKIAVIDDKIRDLRAMRKALQKVTQECDGKTALSCCPIMAAMEGKPL
jgi:MerR family copper efflux transcriptional regulator